jgi:hypothetical protein
MSSAVSLYRPDERDFDHLRLDQIDRPPQNFLQRLGKGKELLQRR